MSAPWEILGVPRDCSIEQLKEAYSVHVKEHPPDKDPEGFCRVNDAYQWMRKFIKKRPSIPPELLDIMMRPTIPPELIDIALTESDKNRTELPLCSDTAEANASSETPAPENAPPAPAPPAAEQTEAERIAAEITEELRIGREWNQPDSLQRALERLLKHWREADRREQAFDFVLAQQFQRDVNSVLPLLTPADAVLDVSRGRSGFASAYIEVLARRGDWYHVMNTLSALEEHLKSHATPEAAEAIGTGAALLAPFEWKRAQQLANLAFPHVGESSRGRFADVDRMLQVGREIGNLKPAHRAILARCLADSSLETKDEGVEGALKILSGLVGAPAAKTCFAERFPQYQRRLAVRKPVAAPRPAPSYSGSSSGLGCSGVPWWLFMVIVPILRLVTSGGSSSTPTYYTPPPRSQPIVSPFRDGSKANPNSPTISLEEFNKLSPEERRKIVEQIVRDQVRKKNGTNTPPGSPQNESGPTRDNGPP